MLSMGKNADGPCLTMPSSGASFLLAMFLLVGTLGYAYYHLLGAERTVASTVFDDEFLQLSEELEPKGRVLVILLDSARKDFMFSPRMSFLSSLRERGAWGFSYVLSFPLSITGQRAIFEGVVASPLTFFKDFLEEFHPSPVTAPNLFMRVTRKGGRAVIFDNSLRWVYGQYADLASFKPKKFSFGEYREEARYVFEQARSFLEKEPWDLAVVPFYAIDYVGHLKTPRSPEYLDFLPVIDDYVRRLVDVTTERDVVLITAEHGMDDNGLHVDRSEIVVEVPFILLGPLVKTGGPKRILQIDWAPTLSFLAGVSPFYPTPALPAFDLLKLPEEEKVKLLTRFSKALSRTSREASLEELRKEQIARLRLKGSLLDSFFFLLGTLLSMALLAYVALSGDDGRWSVKRAVKVIGAWLVGLWVAVGLLFYSGILDDFSSRFLFTADLILSNPLKVSLAFGLVALLAFLSMRVVGEAPPKVADGVMLFLGAFLLVGIFVSGNPYHPLSWAVAVFPLVGLVLGAARRAAWLTMFFAFWAGLAIRRIAFHYALPERWVLVTAVLALGLTYLFWRVRREPERWRLLGLQLLLFLPGVVAIAWPSNVETKALFLALLLVPVVILGSRKPKAKDTGLALWVVFFLLGTSSDLNHLTLLVALPMFLAIWAASRGTSDAAAGLMVTWGTWALYLLPGNGFNFKLRDLGDTFILSSARNELVELTVMVIAARFILPATVLLWGMKDKDSRGSLLLVVSTALLPVAGGIGARLMMLQSFSGVGLLWDHLPRLTVLLGYAVLLLGAFAMVAATSSLKRLARKLLERLAKPPLGGIYIWGPRKWQNGQGDCL